MFSFSLWTTEVKKGRKEKQKKKDKEDNRGDCKPIESLI